MLTLFHIGAAGYWSGATIQAADDAVVPSGWTARPAPELQPGEFAQLTAEGWQTTTTPPPAQVVATPQQLPELVVTAIESDTDHAAATQVHSLADVTCPVGAVLRMRAELRGASGELLPLSDSFRMPIRSRDGRERVLLAVMTAGVMHLDVPMRESGAWSATQASVNEGLPPELQMRFAGVTVHAYET